MLKRGVNVRFLVLNKDCKQMSVIAAALGNQTPRLQSDCDTTYHLLAAILSEWNNMKNSVGDAGHLEFKFSYSLPTFRGYFFDFDNSGPAYMVPYIRGIATEDLPGYLYADAKKTVASKYQSSAMKLWAELPPSHPKITAQP